MNYILQFTTGEKFRINKQEAEAISKAKDDQSITLTRLGMVVQKRMCLIYPEHSADRLEERKKQQTGILHDGTKVVRHFGEWVVAGEIVPDDHGQYQRIKLDPAYYPEVAADCVATEQEWQQIKGVGNYARITGYNPHEKRTSTEGLTSLLEK